MKVIYKHTLQPEEKIVQAEPLRENAKILAFGTQDNEIVFWTEAEVSPFIHEKQEVRDFVVVFTGENFPDGGTHLATVQFPETHSQGRLVCHIYEVIK